MTNEQEEHVEDQTQASLTFSYWTSPQQTAAKDVDRQHLYTPQTTNTSHITPQMQSGITGPHGGMGSMFIPFRGKSNYHGYICTYVC